MLRSALTIAILALGASVASAQARTNDNARFFYGVSAGPEHRSTTNTLRSSSLPAGASQPTFSGTSTALTVEGGVLAAARVGLTAFWDQAFGASSGPGKWGTTTVHATARVWLNHCVWLDAGGGLSNLAYRTPAQSGRQVTQFWAPGVSAGAGVEVIQGPHVSVNLFGRYSQATFDGLSVRRFTVQIGLLGRQ